MGLLSPFWLASSYASQLPKVPLLRYPHQLPQELQKARYVLTWSWITLAPSSLPGKVPNMTPPQGGQLVITEPGLLLCFASFLRSLLFPVPPSHGCPWGLQIWERWDPWVSALSVANAMHFTLSVLCCLRSVEWVLTALATMRGLPRANHVTCNDWIYDSYSDF